MKHIFLVIFFVIGLSANTQNNKTHKVKSGETIESIAKMYLVTPYDIFALNPDAKTKFEVNTVLIIPNSKVKNQQVDEETREYIGYKKHKVRRKETLYSLSKKYNVSIDEIKKENPILYSENLKKGMRIQIPEYKTIISKQSLKNTTRTYVVKPSEGKWRIAYKFGISVSDLEDLNPHMNAVLQPGDVLNVPNIANNEERPLEKAYNYYEVLPKEGFFRLKIKLGLTQEELEAINPELKETGLKAGMVIKIPKTVAYVAPSEDTNITRLQNKIINYKTKNIALMLPYRLNRIDTDSVAETKSMIKNDRLLSVVLDFHSGVLMALDSAKRLGISTRLKVLDTRNQLTHISKLLDENEFSEYDAIIGPMMSNNFDRVASKVKRDRTPVISPFTLPVQVYDNVYQTIPDEKLLKSKITNFVKTDSLKTQVVIIADEINREESNNLKREFPLAKQIFSRKDKDGKEANFIYPTDLENVFNEGRVYVFLETDSKALASSVISLLNGLITQQTEIVLVTLDKNKAFEGDNIDNYHLSNLKFHYPSTNKNYDESEDNAFVKEYKRIYKVTPNKYATRGFDLTLDILLRLASADDLYDASDSDIETEYVENKFRYNKRLFGGYINEAAYIVKYEDLQIKTVN
ncbi:MAG: LysM peptidoglycan-binding domain-containing protein [Winogradskyella sp.]|nr:LysM peptidoglycan-binding domain-containing protein [Winogradskyella sp.]